MHHSTRIALLDRQSLGEVATRTLVACMTRLWHGYNVALEREQLRQLDRRLLDDIGLTEMDVRREVAKPGWRQ